ncbi:MAG: lipid-binding SYLF domain-containing protein [Syntrophobacteraceae bacterium]|jgi:lipid-binding SYLF domain-containing protein
MRYFVVPVLVSFFLLAGPVVAKSEPTPGEIGRIDAATRVFNEMPGRIPAYILENAKGIAVIPGELKAGFVFGGELGGGVIVSRLPNGSWSPPAFISIAGASFGLQIGGEARDIVLVFNTVRSMDYIENGRVKLGGDVAVTAGPVGANAGVTTDMPEIYAYIKSAGAFIGATVEGSVLSFDFNSNRDFYGIPDPLRMEMKVKEIPEPARRFSCAVARYTGTSTKFCS